MAQFVLKIEKLSHIMGPRASQDLRSPSLIMAPGLTESLVARAVKNPLKSVICLPMFIERVIHNMSCIMPGFSMSSYFQSTFIDRPVGGGGGGVRGVR